MFPRSKACKMALIIGNIMLYSSTTSTRINIQQHETRDYHRYHAGHQNKRNCQKYSLNWMEWCWTFVAWVRSKHANNGMLIFVLHCSHGLEPFWPRVQRLSARVILVTCTRSAGDCHYSKPRCFSMISFQPMVLSELQPTIFHAPVITRKYQAKSPAKYYSINFEKKKKRKSNGIP